jgi:hypothetical protein
MGNGIEGKKATNKSIGLHVDDLLMDEMWLGEFEKFMEVCLLGCC